MSNLTETDNFDSGVYAIQTTDAVVGQTGGAGAVGIANMSAQNLTNRTRWLYVTLQALQGVVAGLAALVSPAFSGTPTAPTAATGTTGTQLATCGFGQDMLNGITDVNASAGGSIVLTAAQYGHSMLVIQGNPTSAPTILVPAGVTGRWIVRNALTTNFAVNFGVVGSAAASIATPGTGREFFSDGTNVNDARTDFPSPNLIGTPLCPTPTTANQIANKGYVDSAIASNVTGVSATNGWCRLPNGQIRIWGSVNCTATAGQTVSQNFTMPIAFPNVFANSGVSFGGNQPPAGTSLASQPNGLGQIDITVTAPAGVTGTVLVTYWAEGS